MHDYRGNGPKRGSGADAKRRDKPFGMPARYTGGGNPLPIASFRQGTASAGRFALENARYSLRGTRPPRPDDSHLGRNSDEDWRAFFWSIEGCDRSVG
jgi:hypothetical protein